MKISTKKTVQAGILGSISIALSLTPLGFIPIGVAKATTMHIPVIIGALSFGPLVGGCTGLIFGISSMIQNFTAPVSPMYFVFLNPLVSVLPRFLIGILSYFVFKFLKSKNENLAIIISAGIGTTVNTAGVLGMSYILYKDTLTEIFKIDSGTLLLGIAIKNGPLEILLACLITFIVFKAVSRFVKND